MTFFFITNISWTVWVKSEIFDKKGQEMYVVQLELDKAFFLKSILEIHGLWTF